MREAQAQFPCFGSVCSVLVQGDAPDESAEAAVARARRTLLDWHERFTRFDPGSELSRLNADPRGVVPVRPLMARFAAAVVEMAALTGGLADATLLGEVEAAGYRTDIGTALPLATALRRAPRRRPGGPSPFARWRELSVDPDGRSVRRPPGLRLDSGGVAKGMFADVLAESLRSHPGFAVDCAGDVRVGGSARRPRSVRVLGPFDERVLHTFRIAGGGVATSGISRRSWADAFGAPAHHLLDPATGRPAFTGVVQATAIAPSALEAEARAKAAVLSGPAGARAWLAYGGLTVLDDGSELLVEPRRLRVLVQRRGELGQQHVELLTL